MNWYWFQQFFITDYQASSLLKQQVYDFASLYLGASDQFMNQHLLVKMRQLGVANLGNSFAKAGPMSGAQPMSKANALGLTCDWRLESVHFPCAAE